MKKLLSIFVTLFQTLRVYCCSQGWPPRQNRVQNCQSQQQSTIKIGTIQGWLTSDERRLNMIKKECTESKYNLEFKSSRFEATKSEDGRWQENSEGCLKEWTKLDQDQIRYEGAWWHKDWAYKR